MRLPKFDPNWPVEIQSCYYYDVREYFGESAGGRRTAYPDFYFRYRNRFQQIVQKVQTYLPVGSEVVDIAAAQGNFSLFLAEKGYRVTWNDLRAELADYVRLKYEFGEIKYAPGNLLEVENEHAGKYDGVVATEVLEHVAHPDEFLASLGRLVKAGGYLFVSTPNGRYFRNRLPKFTEFANPAEFETIQFQPDGDGHIFLIYPEEMEMLAERAGLTIRELSLSSNPLTTGELKTKYLLKILPESFVDAFENVTRKLPEPLHSRLLHNLVSVMQRSA